MAFHFNWSPLIADTDRVRHMLTASLNKTPKPPIIVDDIIVSSLNLGSTPPSLEILEVGDLAEDRFRGVFRVKYEGDAFLTLRTKVQANPLNTFLSTKSEWVNPGVGAAGGGLTIPLQITLSDIRLSGFVILVFSKSKGITLVFRNDPLEGLKVSSTFDSIPFVREYLQRTIEGQLRVLFMEDLPAIIHRLSLRVFDAEGQRAVEQRLEGNVEREARAAGYGEEDGEGGGLGAALGFEPRGETFAEFSQKNLVRLMALRESQRTLSLFTPGMRDMVYRAWTTSMERQQQEGGVGAGGGGLQSLHRPTLSRIQSQLNMAHGPGSYVGSVPSALSSAASFTSETVGSQMSRQTVGGTPTTYTLSSTGGHARPRPRKRKNRVVNLRKNRGEGSGAGDDGVSVSSGYETASRTTESAKLSSGEGSAGVMMSGKADAVDVGPILRPREGEREGEVFTPHGSPKKKVGWREQDQPAQAEAGTGSGTIRRQRPVTPRNPIPFDDPDETPRQSMYLPPSTEQTDHQRQPSSRPKRAPLPRMQKLPSNPPPHDPNPDTKHPPLSRNNSELSISDMVSGFPTTPNPGSNGGILEQAWLMKMSVEIAKRVAEEKAKGRPWRPEECGEEAPPAYVS